MESFGVGIAGLGAAGVATIGAFRLAFRQQRRRQQQGQPAAPGPAFKPLRPDQVAFGVPSGDKAANPGNFVSVATIQAAYTCITAGTGCGTHKPAKTYPTFRGVMTWSINWDKFDGPAKFSQPLAQFLHSQP